MMPYYHGKHQLSASPTLLDPSTNDKENHPPPFTKFHTRDILYYFNTKFSTFDQCSKYLQHHLSDWQLDPHFQHFHSLYVQYCTFNNHINSLGKILKMMEKSQDSVKGTIQHLTPLLHEKGLQDQIRSITNQMQPSSVSLSKPLPESSSDDSAISYARSQNQYPHIVDAMKGSFSRPANTLSSMIMCSGKWDEMSMKDTPADVPNPWKIPLMLNHLLCLKQSNLDLFTPVLLPPTARNVTHPISYATAQTLPVPTVGLLPPDTGPTNALRKCSRNTGGRKELRKMKI